MNEHPRVAVTYRHFLRHDSDQGVLLEVEGNLRIFLDPLPVRGSWAGGDAQPMLTVLSPCCDALYAVVDGPGSQLVCATCWNPTGFPSVDSLSVGLTELSAIGYGGLPRWVEATGVDPLQASLIAADLQERLEHLFSLLEYLTPSEAVYRQLTREAENHALFRVVQRDGTLDRYHLIGENFLLWVDHRNYPSLGVYCGACAALPEFPERPCEACPRVLNPYGELRSEKGEEFRKSLEEWLSPRVGPLSASVTSSALQEWFIPSAWEAHERYAVAAGWRR